jgi:ATP-dependent RNA helicase DDX52/ROK1
MKPPAISLDQLEWLVIDECDKLFEMGFREQLAVVYKACSQSPKVRRAMFSATFDSELEKWFQMNLDNVITLVVGGKNRATDLIEQKLVFVGKNEGKLIALRDLITNGLEAPVLIFVDKIERAKTLFKELIFDGITVDVIHSDRSEQDRDAVVRAFREGKIWFLICTELMGRGIDFKGVNYIINYDFPPTKISYIHRIGRTGRAGRTGKAITFFTENDAQKLRAIVSVMRASGCEVPEYMLEMGKNQRRYIRPHSKKSLESKRQASESTPHEEGPSDEILSGKKKAKKRVKTDHSNQDKSD